MSSTEMPNAALLNNLAALDREPQWPAISRFYEEENEDAHVTDSRRRTGRRWPRIN